VIGGTAIPGIDFAPPVDGSVFFKPGQTSATVEFELLNDQQPGESTETLLVGLNQPVGAVIAFDRVATVTIVDDGVILTNPPPLLTLSKTVSPDQANPGDTVTFTLTVGNAGPGVATNVLLNDWFPPGLEFSRVVSGLQTVATNTKLTSWQIDTLAPGTSTAIILESTAVLPGIWTNLAQVQYGTNLPLIASASVLVVSNTVTFTNPPPLLNLSKTASVAEAAVGDSVSFYLTVSGSGGNPTTNVVVQDLLPPGFQFVSAFEGGNSAAYDPGSGLWNLGLYSGGTVRMLTINTFATAPGVWTNQADIVSPGELDPNSLPHGAAFVNVLVPGKADLILVKETDATPVGIEQDLTFYLRIGNQGPDDSKDIVVKDTLPAGVLFQSADAPKGTTFDPKKLEWTISKLAKGEIAELKLVTTAKKALSVTNSAEITATDVPDPNAANNKAQAPAQWIAYSACGTVRFCNAFGGAPHTNAIIELSQNAKVLQTTRSDAQGAFCFTNLPPGKYQVVARPSDPKSGIKDSAPDTIEFGANASGGSVSLLSPYPVIRGVIRYGTNGPVVPDVEVRLVGKTTDGKAIDVKTRTDASGQYLFTDVADGAYTVTPTPGKNAVFTPSKVQIKSIDCLTVANFTYGGALRITGRVLNCDPSPVPYATIVLSQKGFPNLRTVVTAQDGSFAFQGLVPGDYTITATHPTYDIDSVDVTLSDRNVARNLQAKPKKGLIFARVLDPKGAPVSGIDIAIFPPGAATATATLTTDTNGSVTFKNVNPGIWMVQPQVTDPKQSFTPGTDKVGIGRLDTCRNTCIFTVNQNSVELVAMEAVQVIQDWKNSMPLVEGKATLLRIFLKPAGTNTAPVIVKGLKLKVEPEGGKTVTLSAADILARADYAPHRNEKKTSLAFDVTKFAKGTVKFTLQWTNGFLATAPAAAGVIKDNSITAKFTPTPPIQIKWLLVNWKFGADSAAAKAASIADHRKSLLSALPITNIVAKEEVLKWTPTADPNQATAEDNTLALYDLVTAKRQRDEPANSRTIYYTIVPGDIVRDNGIVNGDIVIIREKLGTGIYMTRPAHEVGHTLGRQHDVHSAYGITIGPNGGSKHGACSEIADISAPDYPMEPLNGELLQPVLGPMSQGDYGFAYGWDSSDGTYISPYDTLDLMSYCGGKTDWTWPGLYTYKNLFAATGTKFGAKRALQPMSTGSEVPSFILSGFVNLAGGSVLLDPIWPTLNPTEPSSPVTGNFHLRLYDQAGAEIYAASFAPESVTDFDPAPYIRTLAPFRFVLSQAIPLAAISVDDGTNTLIHRVVSAHAPTVKISTPASPAIPSSEVLLQWNADDQDGDSLLYAVDASSDGGLTWSSLAQNLTGTGWSVSTESLPGGTRTLLRVTASDGLLLASDQISVTIPDHAPSVTIATPRNGDLLSGELPVTLSALATDVEDGPLDGSKVIWTSDRDGKLGEGASLAVQPTALSEGSHSLTVTAIDSLGQSITDVIHVTVVHDDGPALGVTIDGDDFILSWPAAYDLWLPQGSLRLDSGAWFPVSGDPELIGTVHTLRIPTGDEEIFFRVSMP
jgi:uncharacterized repeat protein (TIGR01451 family)